VTGRVRRTVRMAVALVVGQALLCALIGWLTFSHSRSAGSDPGPVEIDQLAAPPPVAMRPSATVRPAPARSAAVPSAKAARPAPRRTTRPARDWVPPAPPARTTAPARPGPIPPPRSPEPIQLPPPPPRPATSWPAAPPSGFLQQPVTVGERCWPEGAFGLTRGRTLVRCDGDPHRPPRWKIV